MLRPTVGQISRFTHGRTCPVCDGSDSDPRGQGRRCHGFLSGDGEWVHCSREDHAGRARYHPESRTYSHKAAGPCPCGEEHAPADPLDDLRKSKSRKAAGNGQSTREIDHVYKYRDADGKVISETVRYKNPKDFVQRQPTGSGQYKWSLKGISPVLYNLPALLAADPSDPVWIVEGEKDADQLGAVGLLATTNPMGALKWREAYSETLAGRSCFIIPDNDQDGRKHAQQVAQSLHGKGATVRVVELPGLPEKGDVSDFLAAGGTVDQIRELGDSAPVWSPLSPILMDEEDEEIGADVQDPIGEVDPNAFHGPLGRLALATQPETEANPLFVLIQLLTLFGIAAGRRPHFIVSATRHYLNLFIALIAMSGFGRKGSSAHVAKEIWRKINPTFTDENIVDGLNSGAGLLHHLRDPSRRVSGKGTIEDEGVADKCRVFLESELSSVLMQGHRENDPLLGHLRKFFDGDDVVRSNTKDPVKVTGGHVSIIGHCTPADLALHLSDVDKSNGTANRFWFLHGVRSKLLPRGGNIFKLLDDDTDLAIQEDLRKLKAAIEFAQTVDVIYRSAEVEARWDQLYREFNNIPPGRIGGFFVRAPVIVLKAASIFALSECKRVMENAHLDAALAIWKHSDRSLRYIFKADVDPRAEQLLAALDKNPEGLTKRQIHQDVFKGHLDAITRDELLSRLLADRTIVLTPPVSRGGRPAGRYQRKVW
jgi:hypothetical protein